jgi:hypothetical protein
MFKEVVVTSSWRGAWLSIATFPFYLNRLFNEAVSN